MFIRNRLLHTWLNTCCNCMDKSCSVVVIMSVHTNVLCYYAIQINTVLLGYGIVPAEGSWRWQENPSVVTEGSWRWRKINGNARFNSIILKYDTNMLICTYTVYGDWSISRYVFCTGMYVLYAQCVLQYIFYDDKRAGIACNSQYWGSATLYIENFFDPSFEVWKGLITK